jgi:hypothetical protein
VFFTLLLDLVVNIMAIQDDLSIAVNPILDVILRNNNMSLGKLYHLFLILGEYNVNSG